MATTLSIADYLERQRDKRREMFPVDYDLGKRILETCTCKCGARLVLVGEGSYGIDGFAIRCTKDIKHTKIAKERNERR